MRTSLSDSDLSQIQLIKQPKRATSLIVVAADMVGVFLGSVAMDQELRRLEREVARELEDPRTPERIKQILRRLRELIEQRRLWPDNQIVKAFLEEYARELADYLRRSGAARRLVILLQRAGQAFGQTAEGLAKKAFRLLPSGTAIDVFFTVLFYAPEPGESGSIAIPFDAYEHVDTLLIEGGDPEGGMKCYVACIYKLVGHFTKGDDPDKRLYHFPGDADAPEICMLSEYNCERPPPENQLRDICQKKLYVQAEV